MDVITANSNKNKRNIEILAESTIKPQLKIVESDTNSYESSLGSRNDNRLNDRYITTLLLNRYRKPGKIYEKYADYPHWFIQSLGITNPYQRYLTLASDGYLETASIDLKLMKLFKKDLEEICERLVISKTGNKIDLVNRILKTPNFERETVYFTGLSDEYVLSDLGKEWITQHEDLLRLSRDYSLSPNRYMEIRNAISNEGINPIFEQISIIMRKDKIQEELKKEDYHLVTNEFHLLSNDYLIIDDRDNALNSLIFSIIYNFSGLGYYGSIESDSHIFGYLKNYNVLVDFDQNEIKSAFGNIVKTIKLPYQKYPFTVMESMIEEYYTTGDIQYGRFGRFTNKAPYITEYGEYWKDPNTIYNF